MNKKGEVGTIGEEATTLFLKKKGYLIIDRNRRMPGGEIDIIARDSQGVLVFVEVKTMSSDKETDLMPEDHATAAKLRKMRQAAMLFAGSRSDLIREDKGWRIDLVAVTLSVPMKIVHYENV